MARRPFHHGNLRAVLLEHAETVLRERGLDALSLRELAREAGVSHGAPRSHFIDRNALIDALAVRGFTRLTEDVRGAAAGRPQDWLGAIRAAGAAYLTFAQQDAALHEVMFAAKAERPSEVVLEAAQGLFTALNELLYSGAAAGAYAESDVPRLGPMLLANLQGTAAFITSRRTTPEEGSALFDDAITVLIAGIGAERHPRTTPGPPHEADPVNGRSTAGPTSAPSSSSGSR